MAELSVTDVQKALRALSSKGHDVLTHPGGVVLDGKKYPLSYGHGIDFETANTYNMRSLIPLNEGGTVGTVSTSSSHPHKTAVLMQPGLEYNLKGNVSSYYTLHPADTPATYNENSISQLERGRKLKPSLHVMTQLSPAYDDYSYENVSDENVHKLLKTHNIENAAWDTINRLISHRSSDNSTGLKFPTLSQTILVNHRHGNQHYLYDIGTEQLTRYG